MKNLFIFFFLILTHTLFGQKEDRFVDGKDFNSVFQNLESGKFNGTVNGLIILKKNDSTKVLLDFQGSKARLEIIIDSNAVYDASTKTYIGYTTSGLTEVKYETYAHANGIGIKLDDTWYELTAIDGACFSTINGLKFTYEQEPTIEYLVLTVDKEIELSNLQSLFRGHPDTPNENEINEIKKKEKIIKLLPQSTIVFAIRRV